MSMRSWLRGEQLERLTLGFDTLWYSGALAARAVRQLLDACPLLTALHLESRTEIEPEGQNQSEYQPPTATAVEELPLQGLRAACQLAVTAGQRLPRPTDSGPWSLDKALSRCTHLAS